MEPLTDMAVNVEIISAMGLSNCLRITNDKADVVVTTEVGPRILRYGFCDGPNLFGEYPDLATPTPLGDWKPYGGHRLWAAPENMQTTYAPDNVPVEYQVGNERSVHLNAPVDAAGLRKQMTVRLAEHGNDVSVHHSITNCNGWGIRLAPWTITVHTNGVIILPREPFRSHDDCVVPAQPMTLWHFTDLEDPRFTLGGRYLLVRSDAARKSPQKIGIGNHQGWCAYHQGQTLLVKRFQPSKDVIYPDCGSNNEAYVAGDYMETELLGPLCTLEPGETVTIAEQWELFPNVHLDESDEESVHRAIQSAGVLDS